MLPKLNTAGTNYFCFNVPSGCGIGLKSRWRLAEPSGPTVPGVSGERWVRAVEKTEVKELQLWLVSVATESEVATRDTDWKKEINLPSSTNLNSCPWKLCRNDQGYNYSCVNAIVFPIGIYTHNKNKGLHTSVLRSAAQAGPHCVRLLFYGLLNNWTDGVCKVD